VTYGPSGSSYSHKVPLILTKPLGHPSFYSISAQLKGSGTVTCAIKVDNKTLSHATASGGYRLATCEILSDSISGGWVDGN
jgi:hypothetical protein